MSDEKCPDCGANKKVQPDHWYKVEDALMEEHDCIPTFIPEQYETNQKK